MRNKIICSLTGFIAFAFFQVPNPAAAADTAPPPDAPYRDAKLTIEQRVKDLLGRMTLAEKISQLSQKRSDSIKLNGAGADVVSLQKLFGDCGPGVVFSTGSDGIETTARRQAACQKYLREQTRLGIPALMVNEALHGLVAKGATIYPEFIALGCTWNPALAEEMGAQIAQEASAAGTSQLLAPLVDVARDPRWGRVEECIGEDPFLVGTMCSAYTRGMQGDLRDKPLAADKCLATLKHFAGYSVPINGINIAPCILGERELRSVYFPPFEKVIRENGVLAVMPSYNEIDGIPSHANHWLLEDVLRGEMGFRGYTYSDWSAVRFNWRLHHVAADAADAARQAIEAGVDLEAPGPECY